MKNRLKTITSHIPLISNTTKLHISSLLVLFALIMYCINPNTFDRKICLLAMFVSFWGDVALNCRPIYRRSHSLLYLGAAFFMIAHLLYATAYYWLICESNKPFFNPGAAIACSFILLLFIVSVAFTIYFKKRPNFMTIVVFSIYTMIIGINFVTINSYSWSFSAASFIGALSFLISDFIIGVETVFKVKSEILRKLVWIFYPIGQILIIACR